MRIVIVGDEREAFAARACARAAGAIDDEIALLITDRRARAVFCAHCRAVQLAEAHVGDVVVCGGCARSLVVYHHFSRTHAAYLGYMADAEEPR